MLSLLQGSPMEESLGMAKNKIGISTQKLHARGPMGLRVLTCEKYLIKGDGQIR